MATAVRHQFDTGYFFQQLADAPQRVLVLDFDTTLARADAVRPMRFPSPVIAELLDCISITARTRVIVVSRKPALKIAPHIPCPETELWGCEGQERIPVQSPAGSESFAPPVNRQTRADTRRTLIKQLCLEGPVAYLLGMNEADCPGASPACMVMPELHLHRTETVLAPPEPLLQFLAEWLLVCAGEVC